MEKEIENIVKIIDGYVTSYNNQEFEKLAEYLCDDMEFKNISHGEIADIATSKVEFMILLEHEKLMYKQRAYSIENISLNSTHSANVTMNFSGTLKVSLPNGVKAGNDISFQTIINFAFRDNKISKIHTSS